MYESETNEQIQGECLNALACPDSIMEPGVYNTISRYIKAGGSPEQVVSGLAESFQGYAQMCGLLGEWLDELSCFAKEDTEELDLGESYNLSESMGKTGKEKVMPSRKLVEDLLEETIKKKFDSSIADTSLVNEQKTPLWLETMITYKQWRSVIYELSEKFRSCVFLNFAIQRISDMGYQSEMGKVTSVSDYLEVFNGVLVEYLSNILCQKEGVIFGKMLPEFLAMSSVSQHSYIYTELLLRELARRNVSPPSMMRLCQELESDIVKK